MHNPFEHRFVHAVNQRLDLDAMKKTAELFLGQHDFLGFSSVKRSKKSTIRNIYKFEVYEKGDEIGFVVTGDGFLYNMVRIIVGTLVEVGSGRKTADEIPGIIESRNRGKAGFTAPPQGLYLKEIYFDCPQTQKEL